MSARNSFPRILLALAIASAAVVLVFYREGIDPASIEAIIAGLRPWAPIVHSQPVERGGTWTTDGPFRETEAAVETMRSRGFMAVEMEAAALYAFATARRKPVLCFAHVTNQMAQIHGNFEKSEAVCQIR